MATSVFLHLGEGPIPRAVDGTHQVDGDERRQDDEGNGERVQRKAQRRARNSEAIHKRQLGHSCAGLELPAQKALPEAEKRSRRLRGAVCVSAHALLRGNHTAGPNCIQERLVMGLNTRLTASEPAALHTSDITFSIGRRVAGGGDAGHRCGGAEVSTRAFEKGMPRRTGCVFN